jgi:hypothetical protein
MLQGGGGFVRGKTSVLMRLGRQNVKGQLKGFASVKDAFTEGNVVRPEYHILNLCHELQDVQRLCEHKLTADAPPHGIWWPSCVSI